MIKHHPTEATLAAYAGGALPHALGLAVATHLVRCQTCRAVKAAAEDIGGIALDELPPTAMEADALALVLARTERPVPPPAVIPRAADLPPPLDTCTFGPWQRLGFGLRWRPLRGSRGILAGLLEGMPGKAIPTHVHAGMELTCVLSGSFVDRGQRYTEGDLAEVEDDGDHRPRIDGDIPCVSFFAADGLRLRGFLGVAQRLMTR